MDRRRLLIVFHWVGAALLIALLVGGAQRTEALGFATVASLWVGMAAWGGLVGPPSPRLPAPAQAVRPWLHRALYACVAVVAVLGLLTLTGRAEAAHRAMILATLALAAGHAAFNVWRHLGPRDGALRRIAPSALHRHL